MKKNLVTISTTFAQDIATGLRAKNKFIPSHYFYNEQGDLLFQKIMELPEYYLTRTEYDILEKHADKILGHLNPGENQKFNLVELGVGDGYKSRILLKHLYDLDISFDYYPIDISGNVLKGLKNSFEDDFPGLSIKTIQDNYWDALENRNWNSDLPTLMVFLGSNMGNFLEKEAGKLLCHISRALKKGDYLLGGFDLKKDPEVILKAYDDSQGVTAAFNKNLLVRINQEFGANFNTDDFRHWPVYDPMSGACKSYLVSMKKQQVWIEDLQFAVDLELAEPIFTEVSRKFSLLDLSAMAEKSGFEVVKDYLDERAYFTDSIWRKR